MSNHNVELCKKTIDALLISLVDTDYGTISDERYDTIEEMLNSIDRNKYVVPESVLDAMQEYVRHLKNRCIDYVRGDWSTADDIKECKRIIGNNGSNNIQELREFASYCWKQHDEYETKKIRKEMGKDA